MAYRGSENTNSFSEYSLCRLCNDNGKKNEAKKFCTDCEDNFCSPCAETHEKFPAVEKHIIVDIDNAKAQTERCERHIQNYIDMYCQNHDDVGCRRCMDVDHSLCQIFKVSQFLQENENEFIAKKIKEDLHSTFNTLKAHCEKLQTEKKMLLLKKAQSLEDIRKFRKEINDRLDELEQNSLTEVDDKYSSLINEIEETITELDAMTENVSSAQDKIAIGKNVQQEFLHAIKGKRVSRCAAKWLEENQTFIQTEDKEFIAEQRILALLKDMNVLGMVRQKCITVNKAPEKDERQQTEGERKPASTEQREPQLHVKGSHSYSIKVKSDRSPCYIVSACTMEDGTIILSDKLNKKLKRFDSSTFTVTDYCDLPGAPQQVCPINMQQVAVCLPYNKQITFIEARKEMPISNMITMDFECYGLAHACDNLYISDSDKSVYIYSLSGQKLKQFGNDQSGQAMFSDIYSLAVNEDGSRIYVTDWNNGLIVLDSNGQPVGEISSLPLNGAWGCCLTSKSSLLVCGYKSKKVLQFGLNGELVGEVVKTTGFNKAVCCNQQMSKLVVAQNDDDDESDDKIEVYDLS